MRTRRTPLALIFGPTLVLALITASCGDSVAPTPRPPSPTVASGSKSMPAPGVGPLQPDNPNDPLLVGYCSAQDRIVTLEGQLLSDDLPLSVALAKMRVAQRAARSAQGMFRGAGEQRLAHLTSRWARSFDEVRARLGNGDQPFDALRPAIAALGNIEEIFTCELDG